MKMNLSKIGLIAFLSFNFASVVNAKNTDQKPQLIVAVIDTGADTTHVDLKNNLWENPGEAGLDANGNDKSKNGIDDDANGLADDFHGWNFSKHNNDLRDENGHGTHISGLIVGLDQTRDSRIKLMVLKYYDSNSSGMANLLSSVRAIKYAVKMGAKIINYSGGGPFAVPEEQAAIAEAEKAGVLFVAAAGNERSNSDQYHYYPANYPLSNIISVTAHDGNGQLLPAANYGLNTVDVAAKGKDVVSSLPGGLRGKMTGTSQATAQTSGLLARLALDRKELTSPQSLIHFVTASGRYKEELVGKTRYATMISFERSMQMADLPMNPITKIQKSLITSNLQ